MVACDYMSLNTYFRVRRLGVWVYGLGVLMCSSVRVEVRLMKSPRGKPHSLVVRLTLEEAVKPYYVTMYNNYRYYFLGILIINTVLMGPKILF